MDGDHHRSTANFVLEFTKKRAEWLSTSRAAHALGIHPITLKRRRNEGYLKHGVHFRKTGESRNSQYIWNVEKCLEVFDFWKAPNKKIEGTK